MLENHHQQSNLKERVRTFAAFANEVICETLWPTRCVLCDTPGEVLCDVCEYELPFLDVWRACPSCGAPFGLHQCDSCNDIVLARMGRERLPFMACASATHFNERTGHIVRIFKDGGEQRLSMDLARLMVRVMPPQWNVEAVTFVPASVAAYRQRGYDHAKLLAVDIAKLLDIPLLECFERPRTKDQRKFDARQRFANLVGSFRLRPDALSFDMPQRLLLIDDVFTTGATLCAACDVLADIAPQIYCLTFARV